MSPQPLRFRDFSKIAEFLLAPGHLEEIKVVSFDVFDTLLYRRCSADCVQLGVAQTLAKHLGLPKDMANVVLGQRDLAYAEIAGRNVADGLDSDAHISEINRAWAERLLPEDAGAAEELTGIAHSAKMQYEKWACYPNPHAAALLAALRERGFRLIYISDMYLGEANVADLLASCGLHTYFDAGYVSGDHALLKRTGRLFQHVIQNERVQASQIMHIGDQELADGRQPVRAGIRSLLSEERVQPIRSMQLDTRRALSEPKWHGIVASNYAAGSRSKQPPSFLVGRDSLGPVFAAYIHGLIEYCQRIGADRVYFLAREGLLLKQLYRTFAETASTGLPDAGYLCVSRLTATKASMRGFGLREIALTAAANSVVTLNRLLKPLELDEETIRSLAAHSGIPDPNSPIELWSAPVMRLTSSSAVQTRAHQIGQDARKELISYLHTCGFLEAKRVVIADVGWGGQIHESMEIALEDIPHPEMHSYFLGTDEKAHQRRKTGLRIQADIAECSDYNWSGAAALKCVHIFENVCRAPHGTVIGHRNGHPLFQDDDARERAAELSDEPRVALIQEGIQDFMAHYAKYVAMTGAPAVAFMSYARTLIARLVYCPRSIELRELGSIVNVANFGSDESLTLANRSSIFRPKLFLKTVRESLWREGTVALSVGRAGALVWAALRERNWLRRMPAGEPALASASQPTEWVHTAFFAASEPGFEGEFIHKSRTLAESFRRDSPIEKWSPAITIFELWGLKAAHLLANVLLILQGHRVVKADLLSIRNLVSQRIHIALPLAPRTTMPLSFRHELRAIFKRLDVKKVVRRFTTNKPRDT